MKILIHKLTIKEFLSVLTWKTRDKPFDLVILDLRVSKWDDISYL